MYSYLKPSIMKYLFFVLSFCFIGSITQAQITIRPQLGFNSSTLTNNFDDAATFGDQLGFQFGLEVQMGRKFYIQPGIFWESANNELRETLDGGNSDFSINRVRVPFMFGYKVLGDDTKGLVDFRLFTGPNASFSVNKDIKETALINRNDFKNAVYGWNFGFGLDIAIAFVDAGYSFGLSEVFEGMASDVRNNLFYVNAGIRLAF